MEVMNTMQMIKPIPKFDRKNFVEWRGSFNGILPTPWHFPSKMVSGLEQLEPILRGAIRELEDPVEGSGHDRGNIGKREPSNIDDMRRQIQQMNSCLAF